MKIGVVRADNRVIVDGIGADVDCSDLSGNIRAIHWDGDKNRGEIEFEPDAAGIRMGNLEIASFARFSFLHERWALAAAESAHMKKTKKAGEAEQRLARAEELQAQLAEFERVAEDNRRAAEARAAEEAAAREKVRDLEERNRALEARISAIEQQTQSLLPQKAQPQS